MGCTGEKNFRTSMRRLWYYDKDLDGINMFVDVDLSFL